MIFQELQHIIYFTRHRTAANLLLVVLIVAGFYDAKNAAQFSDVIDDNVTVSVAWPGAGAEDVDEAIVQVLEPALLSLEGASDANSVSFEGRAYITLEFEPGWDMARATGDVETAIDQISTLPEDADDPKIKRGSWRDRVTDVIVTGPVGVEQLALYSDELVLRLFSAGVTRATISGLAAPETVIELPLYDCKHQHAGNHARSGRRGHRRSSGGCGWRQHARKNGGLFRSDPNMDPRTNGWIKLASVTLHG